MKIETGGEALFDDLTALWERSVRASHDFLSEEHIEHLRPAVRSQALPSLELWVARDDDGALIGFMGLSGNTVEALFLDPAWFGRGAGRAFLDHALGLKGPLLVEVNEDNPKALAFYERYGFKKIRRTPADSAGRPFPIIKMAMPGARKE